MAVIIETTTPNITVTSNTSLSDRGRPTCFNPFLAVTKAIMQSQQKSYIWELMRLLLLGWVSPIQDKLFCTKIKIKNENVPANTGEVTQLAAIVPTFPHDTA